MAVGDASRGIAQIGKMSATVAGHSAQQMPLHEEEEEEEQPQLSVVVAVTTLVISTVFVALCSEFMVCLDLGITPCDVSLLTHASPG